MCKCHSSLLTQRQDLLSWSGACAGSFWPPLSVIWFLASPYPMRSLIGM
jgi:hypothetical protein